MEDETKQEDIQGAIQDKIDEIGLLLGEENSEIEDFEIADIISAIENPRVKVAVTKEFAYQLRNIPDFLNQIMEIATPEERKLLEKEYEKNKIPITSDSIRPQSIEMSIAEAAARNWGQPMPETLAEAKKITDGSEIAAIDGILDTLGIHSRKIREGFIECIDNVTEFYDIFPEEISLPKWKGSERLGEFDSFKVNFYNEIFKPIKENINQNTLNILSTIHDSWVKKHPDNFMKVNDSGERRNKERQFVPLELLDFGEVKSDLIFLKPILESAREWVEKAYGINATEEDKLEFKPAIIIDEEQLKKEFELRQQQYMIDNGIFSHEDLVAHLSNGAAFYPALEGLETPYGGSIEELLQNPQIVEEMAKQIESRVPIKSREELAKDIKSSTVDSLDEVLWIQSEKDDPNFDESKLPTLNGPISKREILLSKLIGEPYPPYIFDGIEDYKHDQYRAIIREPKDGECDIADAYARKLKEKTPEVIQEDEKLSIADSVKKALLSSKGDDIGLVVRLYGDNAWGERGQELDDEFINGREYLTPKVMTKKQYENGIRNSNSNSYELGSL